jgi:hypothetical protein
VSALEGVGEERSAMRTVNGYQMSTSRPTLQRVHSKTSVTVLSCTTSSDFEALGRFLGRYWNVAVASLILKNSAMIGEREHVLVDAETVRAIIELGRVDEDALNERSDDPHREDEEAALLALEATYGLSGSTASIAKRARRLRKSGYSFFDRLLP